MISLGGLDDGRLVVWDIEKRFEQTKDCVLCEDNVVIFRLAICGAQAKNEVTGTAHSLCALNKLNSLFLTCGERKCIAFSPFRQVAKF